MKIALILPHTQEENGIMTTGEYSKHDGYEHKYAQLIQEFGHEATVYYFSHKKEIKHFKHAYGHDVVRVPITFGFGPGKQISLQLLKVLKDDKPDVVHILSYYALEYDVLAVWSKINGVPLVSQYHAGGRLVNYILRYPFLFFTIHLSKVLYTRPQEKSNLDRLFANSEFLPNWVDETVFKDSKLRRKPASILFIGNVWSGGRKYYKGYDVLQEAFKKAKEKMPDLTLDEYGKGTKGGRISTEKLVRAYNTHELCVIPSRIEPFSLVALEAVSCGCPVLITDAFGVAPLLKNFGYELIVQPGDSSQLSEKIIEVLENKKIQKEQVEAGKKAIREVFNKGKIGKKLIRVYSELAHC